MRKLLLLFVAVLGTVACEKDNHDVEYNVIDQDALALEGGDLIDTFSIGFSGEADNTKGGNFFSNYAGKNSDVVGSGEHLFSGIVEVTATQTHDGSGFAIPNPANAATGSVSVTLTDVTVAEANAAIDGLLINDLPAGTYAVDSEILNEDDFGSVDGLGSSGIKFLAGDPELFSTSVDVTDASNVASVTLNFVPSDGFVRVAFAQGPESAADDTRGLEPDGRIKLIEFEVISSNTSDTIELGYNDTPDTWTINITVTPNDTLFGEGYPVKTGQIVLDAIDGYSFDHMINIEYTLNGGIIVDGDFGDFTEAEHEGTITLKRK